MARLLRPIVLLAVWLLGLVSVVTPSSAAAPDRCTMVSRVQAQRLLLGHRVLRVNRRENTANHAVECTWITGFLQTPSLRGARRGFSLQLTLQPVATATAALDDLRTRVRTPTNETTSTIPDLGTEAYADAGDAIVVSGDLVFEVGVRNSDPSAPPHPAVNDIARRAATLVLAHLAGAPSSTTGYTC